MARIAVIGPEYADSFAENICDGLREIGVEAVALGPARPALVRGYRAATLVGELAFRSAAVDQRAQRRHLLTKVAPGSFDAAIVVDQLLTPDLVAELKRRIPVVVYWFPDPLASLGRQTMIQAPYDAVFSKEPAFVDPCRDLVGLPFHYLAEACNPRHHRVDESVEREPHVAVAGNYYPYRIRLLERLQRAGVPLRLYGNPFPRWNPSPQLQGSHTGRYVVGLEKSRVFRGAAAVLNAVHPAEIDGLNCRLFEATAAGATVLTEPQRMLDSCFETGTEVLVFADFDELVDQARWCLDHPTDARAIGDRASARSHAEHTYAVRLTELLATVGVTVPGSM